MKRRNLFSFLFFAAVIVAVRATEEDDGDDNDFLSPWSSSPMDLVDTDQLYLDNVKPVKVPGFMVDRRAEARRVRKYARNGRNALARAKAIGRALARFVRSSASAANAKMRDFQEQLRAVKVTPENASAFQQMAAEAEAATGSIVRLGREASVVGLGKTDPQQTWDIFREINREVKRQTRRQIFNSGIQYLQQYGHPKKRFPVVLIPGFGGTRLQARLKSKKSPNPCGLGSNKLRDVWLSSRRLFQYMTRKNQRNCLYDVLSLRWSGSDFKSSRRYKVKRVRGTRGVDLLDRGVASSLSEYFKPLITALVTIGYRREDNLRALGYDWRYRPNSAKMARAFKRWRQTIENMYESENNTPVVVVAHAMGAQHAVYFLEHIINKDATLGRAWIDKYIHSFVSIGGNHAGAPRVIKSLISGTRFSLPFFNRRKAGNMLASFGSAAFMLPATAAWGSKPLLVIKEADGRTRGYSALRMERLLERGFVKPAAFHYNKVAKFLNEPANLVRDSHFLFGTNVPTPLSYIYEVTQTRKGLPKGLRLAATERGPGDGFVPVRSASHLCRLWKNAHCRAFPKVNHRELLWHLPLLAQVLEIATNLRNSTTGLQVPNVNPLDHIDVDNRQAAKPTFESAPDLGMPADVDGVEPVLQTRPDNQTPLFGSQ